MSKTQKDLKKGEATPIIAKTERKGFVATAQARLVRVEKREKALAAIVEKRTATIAKMQKKLDVFKTALAKVKKQKESELTAIQELTAIFSNTSKI
jgi:hypothetical protein